MDPNKPKTGDGLENPSPRILSGQMGSEIAIGGVSISSSDLSPSDRLEEEEVPEPIIASLTVSLVSCNKGPRNNNSHKEYHSPPHPLRGIELPKGYRAEYW